MTAARARMSDQEFCAPEREPQGFVNSRMRSQTVAFALVTVPDGETPLAYWVSTDGDDSKAVAVPKSQIKIVARAADGLFILATMKGWVSIDRKMQQSNIPNLTKSVEWTDVQREAWKALRARLRQIKEQLADQHKPFRFRKRRRA